MVGHDRAQILGGAASVGSQEISILVCEKIAGRYFEVNCDKVVD